MGGSCLHPTEETRSLYVQVALRVRWQTRRDPGACTRVCTRKHSAHPAPGLCPPAAPGAPASPRAQLGGAAGARPRPRPRCSAGPGRGAAAPPGRSAVRWRVMQGRGGAGGWPRSCFAARGLFCTPVLFFHSRFCFAVRFCFALRVLFCAPVLFFHSRFWLALPVLLCTPVAAPFPSASPPPPPPAFAAAAGPAARGDLQACPPPPQMQSRFPPFPSPPSRCVSSPLS